MTASSIVKLVGSPTKSSWAQVYSFEPSEEDKKLRRGELIAVLAAIFPETSPIEAGREILARLHEEYFGKTEGGAFAALSNAVRKVAQEFTEGDRVLCQELEIVACAILGSYVYFYVRGKGKVLLYRNGQLVTIAKGESPRAQEEFIGISGEVLRGDVFLLGTREFFEAVAPGVLRQSFREGATTQEIIEALSLVAHASQSATLGAAIFQAGPAKAEDAGEETLAPAPEAPVSSVLEQHRPSLGKWTQSLRDIFMNLVRRLPEKKIYVKGQRSPSRRTAVSVGIILLILLSASIVFGLRQKGIREYKSSFEEELKRAQVAYSDSLLQKDVDPGRSRELFLEARGIVKGLESRGVKDRDLSDLARKLEGDTATILGQVEAKTSTLIDLSLVRSGISASELAIDGDTLAIFDSEGKRIISVSALGKSATVIAGPEKLKDPRAISTYSGRYFSVGGDGVVEVDKKGSASVVVKPDTEWGEIAKIGVFGGNIYLLDKGSPSADSTSSLQAGSGSSAIWRYSSVEGGFGSRQAWLGKGVTPDFVRAVDIAIDGSIWVLVQDGKISKFTRGAIESFRITGLEQQLLNPTALYTDEELDKIYVLDRDAKRIIELNKKGEYQKQYESEDIGAGRDIVASQKEGKIFLLTETKVLEIPLK
ncbi:MAG: hypothetical protein HY377_01830 [Candidatus Blackburnbacteria bacterium]|nr:hypothetical protein [Candidatus Blackburnbacteria bacterium]